MSYMRTTTWIIGLYIIHAKDLIFVIVFLARFNGTTLDENKGIIAAANLDKHASFDPLVTWISLTPKSSLQTAWHPMVLLEDMSTFFDSCECFQ